MKRTVALLLSLVLCAACSGGDSAETPRRAIVFAAASLTASFQALAAEFERRHAGVDVELHFAGTPQLVMQLRERAPADVFAAADHVNMQRIVDAGLAAAAPTVFAQNALAIVVPEGNPKGIGGLADLSRNDLRVALCGPEIPAGRYARQAIHKAGVVVTSSSDEPNVKALVGKVRLRELDAGIVYRTDTRDLGVDGVDIPLEHNVVATYPIVALQGAPTPDLAADFIAFVQSPDAAKILLEFGFRTP